MKKIIITIILSFVTALFTVESAKEKPGLFFKDSYAAAVSKKADALLLQNKPKEALHYLFDEIEKHPNNAEIHLKAALLMADLGIFEDAFKLLENAINVKPQKDILDEVLEYVFNIARHTNHYNYGISLLKKAQNEHPDIEQIPIYIRQLEVLKAQWLKNGAAKHQTKGK